jgi:predicted transcriptional regulator
MNYIELINFFWRKHEEHLFGPTEIALYFHLLDISNKCNWTNPFKRRNTKICSDLNISKPTLDRSRNKLSQAGLIRFISVGKGDPNIKYILMDGTEKEQEKLKNITSDVTTPVTSPVTSNVQHNINLKQKQNLGEVEAITSDAGFNFFKQTANCRLLREKYNLETDDLELHFKNFFDSKVDLGEFKNKKLEDIARNFYYWLPIHIQILEKEKSSGQKEKAHEAQRGVAAVLTAFSNVKRRPMQ